MNLVRGNWSKDLTHELQKYEKLTFSDKRGDMSEKGVVEKRETFSVGRYTLLKILL